MKPHANRERSESGQNRSPITPVSARTHSALQSVQAVTQAGADGDQPAHDFTKPWFNTETARAYVDSPSLEAFRKWAHRKGIQFRYRGARLLVAKLDLDRAIGSVPRGVSRKAS